MLNIPDGKLLYPKDSLGKYPTTAKVVGVLENQNYLIETVRGIYEEISRDELEYHFWTMDD